MLTNLGAGIIAEKNKVASPNPFLLLCDVVLDASHKYYLACNNENVTWNGQLYTAAPFELDAQETGTSGKIPNVRLKLYDQSGVIEAVIDDLGGAVGARVTTHMVNNACLAQNTSELDVTYVIQGGEDAVSRDGYWCVILLGPRDPQRIPCPRHRTREDGCEWEFKGDECGYDGAETNCKHTYDACVEYGNTLNFGGEKGLALGGWRYI